MENLIIKGSFKLPNVSFNAEQGIFEIEGKSIPERTSEFYDPILEWLDRYIKNPKEETILNVKLEYCNSASTRYVLDIFERLDTLYKNGNKVTANWYYEEDDEDMLELGKSYDTPIKLPINFIAVSF